MKWLYISLIFVGILITTTSISMGKGEDLVIQNGRRVSFDYTLIIDDNVVYSCSEGREPLQYTHGKGEIIPGLSRQLEGLHLGDEKIIVLSPEEAYGAVDPNAFKEVSRSSLPATVVPKVGMTLKMENADGNAVFARIIQLEKDTVVIDFNHPLAGKKLYFQVKVVSIK